MTRNRIFIALVVVALAAAAVALQMLVRRGKTSVKPAEQAQTPEHPVKQQQSNLQQYIDSGNGFAFQYPTDIFTSSHTAVKLPWKDKSIDSFILTHTVPVQHCGLSGRPQDCTPTTTDISIAFTPLQASLADVLASAKATFGDYNNATFGSTSAKTATLGIEGEGNGYYFVALSDTTSLMITRSFIDEAVVAGYQKVGDFIPKAKQEQIFADLMKTLTLGNSNPAADTSSWKIYPNASQFYQAKYPADWVVSSGNNQVTFDDPANEAILRDINKGKMWGEGFTYTATIIYYPSIADEDSNKYNLLGAKTIPELIQKDPSRDKNYKTLTGGSDTAYRTSEGGLGVYDITFIGHSGHLYKITFNGDSDDPPESVRLAFIQSLKFAK